MGQNGRGRTRGPGPGGKCSDPIALFSHRGSLAFGLSPPVSSQLPWSGLRDEISKAYPLSTDRRFLSSFLLALVTWQFPMKKGLSLLLNSLGSRTDSPSVRPYWFHYESYRKRGNTPQAPETDAANLLARLFREEPEPWIL